VVSLAQQFDILDICRDFGWQRGLRVGLEEPAEAEYLRRSLQPLPPGWFAEDFPPPPKKICSV
jgi:hypothetical protein